ncbi:hypothetical protein Q5O24_09330 [Eubacteriaceae bacterium ES3]|nr:hypothetical protein Q5O24_09330 [Eubacteriaceae bacterium ES3]
MKRNLILAGTLALLLVTGGTAMASSNHGYGSGDGTRYQSEYCDQTGDGICDGTGGGYQNGTCDYNADGICDGSGSFIDADGDGLCDNCDGTQAQDGSGSMHRGRHR